jgi:autotransporter-associated beta strand protein
MKLTIFKKIFFFTVVILGMQLGSPVQVDAQALYTAEGGNWLTPGNWQNNEVPTSGATQHLQFNRGTTTSATHNLGAFTLNQLDFSTPFAGISTITILSASGNTLTFDGVNPSINRTDSGYVTFNAVIEPAVIINQTLTVNGPLGFSNGAVLLQGGLTGTGGVNVNGNLSFRGGGLYNYSGDTVINTGFRLTASGSGSGDQLSSNSAHTINGQLNIADGDSTIGSLSGSGELRITGGSSLAVGALNTDTHFSGTSIENGSFIKIGTGTQTLTGNFAHTGGTTVSEGALIIQGSLGTGTVTVADNSILGGDGTIGGSLHFESDANLLFEIGNVLSIFGDTVTFEEFGVQNLIGLDDTTDLGTYTLLDGTATFDFSNLENFGLENAYDLGDGKLAYFQSGGLQVVVVPEPATGMLFLAGVAFLSAMIRRRQYEGQKS